jgi:hypothetical protein
LQGLGFWTLRIHALDLVHTVGTLARIANIDAGLANSAPGVMLTPGVPLADSVEDVSE